MHARLQQTTGIVTTSQSRQMSPPLFPFWHRLSDQCNSTMAHSLCLHVHPLFPYWSKAFHCPSTPSEGQWRRWQRAFSQFLGDCYGLIPTRQSFLFEVKKPAGNDQCHEQVCPARLFFVLPSVMSRHTQPCVLRNCPPQA